MALITLGIIGWFSLQGNRSTDEKDHLVSHSRDILEASESLRSHVYDAAAARRAYVRWGNSKQIDAFTLAYKSAHTDLATLRELTADSPEQQLSITQMEPPLEARLSVLKSSVELHQKNPNDSKQQDAFNDEITRLSTPLTELLDVFDRSQRDLLKEQTSAAQTSYQQSVKINAFLGVSVFLFLILTLGFLNRELSRREHAERAAAEQKDLLQSILDSCSDAVIVANTAGKIILRNPVGARYNVGVAPDELSEEYPRRLGLYKNDRETLFKTYELPLSRALAGESANGFEVYVRPPNGGEPKWVLVAGGPLLNSLGEKRGGVVFLRD